MSAIHVQEGHGAWSQDGNVYIPGKLDNQETLKQVATEFSSKARNNRIFSAGNLMKATVYYGAYAAVAYAIGKLASLFVAVAAFPLMVLPPLYGLVIALTHVAVGLYAFKKIKDGPDKVWQKMKAQWNEATHFNNKAREFRTLATQVQRVPA